MGDRCWLNLYFNKKDAPRIVESGVFGDPTIEKSFNEFEENGQECNGTMQEANYGCYDELNALAKLGIPFHGHHDAGGNYGPAEFCSWEGQYYKVASLDGPVVRVDLDGNPYPEELAKVRQYCEVSKKARAYCQANAEGTPPESVVPPGTELTLNSGE